MNIKFMAKIHNFQTISQKDFNVPQKKSVPLVADHSPGNFCPYPGVSDPDIRHGLQRTTFFKTRRLFKV